MQEILIIGVLIIFIICVLFLCCAGFVHAQSCSIACVVVGGVFVWSVALGSYCVLLHIVYCVRCAVAYCVLWF